MNLTDCIFPNSLILKPFSFSKVDRVHNAIFFLHLHQSIMKDYRVFLRYRNLFSMSTVPKNKYLLTDAPSIPSYRPSMENNSKGTPIEVRKVVFMKLLLSFSLSFPFWEQHFINKKTTHERSAIMAVG